MSNEEKQLATITFENTVKNAMSPEKVDPPFVPQGSKLGREKRHVKFDLGKNQKYYVESYKKLQHVYPDQF